MSGWPRRFSSSRILWLTADCDTKLRSAAAVNERVSIRSQNVWSVVRSILAMLIIAMNRYRFAFRTVWRYPLCYCLPGLEHGGGLMSSYTAQSREPGRAPVEMGSRRD